MKLNERFSSLLSELGLRFPEVLLPKSDVDLSKWSVVACDQYTSDHAYWNAVEQTVGTAPSSLRVTLPEIFLEKPEVQEKIRAIHEVMARYLNSETIENIGECLMYVERKTEASGLRQGIVLAMDLEKYDYSPGSKSLIRATEGTIVDRIPPRLQVRRAAQMELPHIMILIDDPAREIIEHISLKMVTRKPAYDIELMAGGGHLTGYKLQNEDELAHILTGLQKLLNKTKSDQATETPLFFAMGDGNHSLATAKALWEEIKAEHLKNRGNADELQNHPARYALAEIVNIHSPGLRFEPIHRALFTAQPQKVREFIESSELVESLQTIEESKAQALLASPDGQQCVIFYDGISYFKILFRPGQNTLPPALVDQIHAGFRAIDPLAKIDFIHGWNDNKKLVSAGAVCFFVPVIKRERLFAQVQQHGPLPRKAFSMGEAEEKRYYMEARRIAP